MPFMISRLSHLGGLALPAGIKGWMIAHCLSVRSFGLSPFRFQVKFTIFEIDYGRKGLNYRHPVIFRASPANGDGLVQNLPVAHFTDDIFDKFF